MDELTIKSKWLTCLISKIVKKELKKKGIDGDLKIESLTVKAIENCISGHIDASFTIEKDSITKLLN